MGKLLEMTRIRARYLHISLYLNLILTPLKIFHVWFRQPFLMSPLFAGNEIIRPTYVFGINTIPNSIFGIAPLARI